MRLDELERYLTVGGGVTVEVRRCPGIPGVVRTTTLHRENSVTIEYEIASVYALGESEGFGPKYIGRYETFPELVERLEQYFDCPVAAWRNYSMSPFAEEEVEEGFDHATALRQLEDLVRARAVELPVGGGFRIADVHFRHIEKYGEFREDKICEEQDEYLEESYGPG